MRLRSVGCGIILLASLAHAAAAPLAIFDATTRPTTRASGLDASIDADGALRLVAPASTRFARVDLDVPTRDLSAYRYVEADVENASADPVRFTVWALGGPGFSGASSWTTSPFTRPGSTRPTTGPNPAGYETLAAGERRVCRIDLFGRFPGRDAHFPVIDARDVREIALVTHPLRARSGPAGAGLMELRIHSVRAVAGSTPPTFDLSKRVVVPPIEDGPPMPGKRVWRSLPGEKVRHVLTLPREWKPDGNYPVIVEFTGNVFYDKFCHSTGLTEQGNLAYGLARGERFITLNLPFVAEDGTQEQTNAWGSPERTIDYCLKAIDDAVTNFGADRSAIFYTGFSRGEIGANYIALRDDRIAALWRGFIGCDPATPWTPGETGWNGSNVGFAERAARLRGRPTFKEVPDYGYGVHVDVQYLEDTPATIRTRAWLDAILRD